MSGMGAANNPFREYIAGAIAQRDLGMLAVGLDCGAVSVQELVSCGVDINEIGDDKMSMLHYAVLGGNLVAVGMLVDSGANLYGDEETCPAIYSAVGADFPLPVLEYFYQKGYNFAGEEGTYTMLHHSVRQSHFVCTKWLMDHGADPLRKDEEGRDIFAFISFFRNLLFEGCKEIKTEASRRALLGFNFASLDQSLDIIQHPERYALHEGELTAHAV